MKEEYFLGKKELETSLLRAGWKRENNSLNKDFRLRNFIEVVDFINILSGYFEEMHHHPDFSVTYNCIQFSLISHNVGKVTEIDFVVAQLIETVYLSLTNR